MEVIGKIIHVLPPQSGTSQAGNRKAERHKLETSGKNKNMYLRQKTHILRKYASTSSETG